MPDYHSSHSILLFSDSKVECSKTDTVNCITFDAIVEGGHRSVVEVSSLFSFVVFVVIRVKSVIIVVTTSCCVNIWWIPMVSSLDIRLCVKV